MTDLEWKQLTVQAHIKAEILQDIIIYLMNNGIDSLDHSTLDLIKEKNLLKANNLYSSEIGKIHYK